MEPIDLCQTPAGESPNNVYNFKNPPSLGPAVVAVGVVLGVISTTFGVGRLYINRKRLHSADYFTLIAVVVNIAFIGVISSQFRYYRHSWDIPVCWYSGDYLKLPFVQTVLFAPAFFFPKAAIFLLYRQLFAIQKNTRIAIGFGLLVTLLVYLSNIPLAAVYAAPRIGHSWDSLLQDLRANSRPFALGGTIQSAIGTVLDFYIFFLPLPILFHLEMEIERRIQLIAIFSTALLGVAASIVSLVFKVRILSSTDSAWLAGASSLASLIETNIAIIVGSMPAFAHVANNKKIGSGFFRTLRSRLLGSPGQSAESKSSGAGSAGNQANRPVLVTFGSNQPRRKDYYELNDASLLKSQGDTMVDHTGEEHEMNSKAASTQSEAEQNV
ncbi:hypothetical protein F4801DRAFT_581300 [Xylaria longipes]|nr:hypothetical protein F4801DRAFT_581300 [Xylaria longipes]RYC59913.1 hypothetical protein CHU98_g6285 [Xylaria longipes]